ncbi:glycoside hydrolase family 92 protein [Maribacter polysiphoniae]|uniref:Glycoside hydrolase family 92 protein n=1 Tax=Maribacter polysiphoniae TaxID=429344 RepID=A0A316E322_9FLAO|nr:GH92 family glycosyl hydrolase [Maribacter polysiphoniae]MBD1260990.1 glycoside hydrolase family 92 protein [Maribacter polysiphoniae]PWK23769.1 putative alpha-1,2-mannosidase [Maribacter polysiphoniae]
MKNLLNLIYPLTFSMFFACTQIGYTQAKTPSAYVDPFIGTDFFGHTYPGAALPNALVHLSPDVYTEGWTYCAGYIYSESSIMGFSHTHWSGVGMVNGGEILLMPTVNQKLQIVPGSLEDPDAGYRSRFDHSEERATPGYYTVKLKDYDVNVELTATQRAGFHRYTFPESTNSRIILDVGHQIGDMTKGELSELKIVDDHRIEGAKGAGLGKVYFVAEFSKPFLYYGTFDATYKTPESNGSIFPYKNAEVGDKIGAFVQYHTAKDEQVLVKVGLSYTSIEGARRNLQQEIPNWDFDGVRDNAKKIWDKELSKITVKGGSEDQKQIFTTALYRSLLAQYISQDVDGKYFGSDGKIHEAKDFDFYGSFSCWDTYRTQHPLLTLVAPEHVNDYIKSIAAKVENYGWLPAQHFLNVYGESMVGDHLIPIIVDAYLKGYRDFDINLLYKAMRKKALELPKSPISKDVGRSGLTYYLEKGYAPIDKVTEAVPNTLELAYDDWCIAQLAKALNKPNDYALFMKRANNYKNVWDSKTQFMRPKKYDGTWLPEIGDNKQEIIKNGDHSYYKYFDPLLVGRRPNRHYTESNAWQYIWSVQHDPQGLISLFGNKKEFIAKLDTFFEMSPVISPPKYVGVVGTIGQYVHGNQPSHHVAYLYNYAGQPWKTQFRARQVMDKMYRIGPGGLPGNEDMGSLSSWYVLSAMGIYPMAPGNTVYTIGSPLFDELSLHPTKNKTFTVRAQNNSKKNVYIQSATFNGKPFNRTWITHEEIVKGGVLQFKMGPQPNTKWGTDKIPTSLLPN